MAIEVTRKDGTSFTVNADEAVLEGDGLFLYRGTSLIYGLAEWESFRKVAEPIAGSR